MNIIIIITPHDTKVDTWTSLDEIVSNMLEHEFPDYGDQHIYADGHQSLLDEQFLVFSSSTQTRLLCNTT